MLIDFAGVLTASKSVRKMTLQIMPIDRKKWIHSYRLNSIRSLYNRYRKVLRNGYLIDLLAMIYNLV